MKTIALTEENKEHLLRQFRERGRGQYAEEERQVARILEDVQKQGDEAVFRYTQEFDHRRLTADTLFVTEEEIRSAYASVPDELLAILRRAKERIFAYHEKQKRTGWFYTEETGICLGAQIRPMERVGLYVPGGKAAYPSSVLMNAIPAKVAGVQEMMMATPCSPDGRIAPAVLVAAKEAGIDSICKIGGAQAIAAMAYGTDCIPKVDKIVGPGNIYVALAKKAVFGEVSIDSVAGPSEILVLADASANPKYVAADLLSQAEHDEMAAAVLVTTSRQLAETVTREIERMLPTLPRQNVIEKSLENYGVVLLAESMSEAIDAVNAFAPEHLEVQTEDPMDVLPQIRHAGAIFLGTYSSEPLGDYMAGPNHVLPTGGTARFFSPLSVDDFIKKSSVIRYSKEALAEVEKEIIRFAEEEGLQAHAQSIAVRFSEPEEEVGV